MKMKIKFNNHVFACAFSLFLLPLFAGSCGKICTCHQAIKVVNNSERAISVRDLSISLKNGVEHVWLNGQGGSSIAPHDTAIIQVIIRSCLETYYNSPMVYYVLPDDFPCIKTTRDSLYIVYDVLKTIDLQELGVDSLVKTDYTVYYP